MRLILAQCDLLRKKPVGAAELRRAKEYTIGSNRMALERTSSQNMRLGGSVLAHGRIAEPESVNEKIRKVDAAEIQSLAQEILDPARLTLSVVGPNPDETMLKNILAL